MISLKIIKNKTKTKQNKTKQNKKQTNKQQQNKNKNKKQQQQKHAVSGSKFLETVFFSLNTRLLYIIRYVSTNNNIYGSFEKYEIFTKDGKN